MLDTSALADVIPGEVVDGIENYGASFIVRAELMRGLRRYEGMPGMRHAAAVRAKRIAALDGVGTFWQAFDAAASEAYANLIAEPGSAARSKDALIAAHAVAVGCPLITADRGFTRFRDLEVRFV